MPKKSESAIILEKEDNVATVTTNLKKGDTIQVSIGDYVITIVLAQNIPYGHKFALKDIKKRETIVKYGEVIGRAMSNISKGEHAHIHNIEGLRGRGDKQ